jgi:hypothetical protein
VKVYAFSSACVLFSKALPYTNAISMVLVKSLIVVPGSLPFPSSFPSKLPLRFPFAFLPSPTLDIAISRAALNRSQLRQTLFCCFFSFFFFCSKISPPAVPPAEAALFASIPRFRELSPVASPSTRKAGENTNHSAPSQSEPFLCAPFLHLPLEIEYSLLFSASYFNPVSHSTGSFSIVAVRCCAAYNPVSSFRSTTSSHSTLTRKQISPYSSVRVECLR